MGLFGGGERCPKGGTHQKSTFIHRYTTNRGKVRRQRVRQCTKCRKVFGRQPRGIGGVPR